MNIYELAAIHDSRKSFGHKATVSVEDDGTKTLLSYETPVIRLANGKVERLNTELWGMTTRRHIREFFKQNGIEEEL